MDIQDSSNLWDLLIGIAMTLITFFTRRTIATLDGVKDQTIQTQLDLEKYKNEVANTYAKETSLSRIHDRIDDVAEDIKTLLREVGK